MLRANGLDPLVLRPMERGAMKDCRFKPNRVAAQELQLSSQNF